MSRLTQPESCVQRWHSWWHYLTAVPLVIALGACGLFGGDKDEDPPAELVKFKSTLKIKKLWSSSVGDGSENLRLALAPATNGVHIFAAAHDGRVAAFDPEKGNRIWKNKTDVPLSAGPVAGPYHVIVGSNDGDVIALDAKNGVELWRVQVSSEVLAQPALSGKLVFIRTVDGKLTALDIDNGKQVWGVQQSVPRLSVRGTAAPVVTNSMVISGFDNGRLAAYDLSDGGQVWNLLLDPPQGRTEIERLADLNATVKAVGNDLYAVGYQGRLASVAVESGQLLWSREMSSYAGLTADFNNLYISGQHSQLVAVSRRSGREIWQKDVLHNRDITGPTAFGSSVVVGDFEGYLHWFDPATGELQTRVRAGSDRITTAPLVVSDTLYVVTDGGKLVAFRGVVPKRES